MAWQRGQDHDGLWEGVPSMGKNLRSELRTLRRIVSEYPMPPFTQEDVDLLRQADVIQHVDDGGVDFEPGAREQLDSLADRIEALLQPGPPIVIEDCYFETGPDSTLPSQ